MVPEELHATMCARYFRVIRSARNGLRTGSAYDAVMSFDPIFPEASEASREHVEALDLHGRRRQKREMLRAEQVRGNEVGLHYDK